MNTPLTKSVVTVLNPDGSVDWWELTDQWRKILTDPPIASLALANHSHLEHGNINFTGNIKVGNYDGVNERVVIGSKRLTFKEGVCIAIEDV